MMFDMEMATDSNAAAARNTGAERTRPPRQSPLLCKGESYNHRQVYTHKTTQFRNEKHIIVDRKNFIVDSLYCQKCSKFCQSMQQFK